MAANRAFKKRVRARAAQTGESYTAALRHVRSQGATVPIMPTTLRLAVAQTAPLTDPADAVGLRARGAEIRRLMQRAHDGGARLLQLPEAALCFPLAPTLSRQPDEVTESDWVRFDWATHDAEVEAIRAEAARLRLWTVIGAPVRAADVPLSARPWLSVLVIDPRGMLAGRYDERLLSRTKQTYMYAAGSAPVSFVVDGVRFACLSGLEGLFGDLFTEAEAAGADCVLYSTAGPGDAGAETSLSSSAAVAARQHGLWVSYAVHADKAPHAPAGVCSPSGEWAGRCVDRAEPDLVAVDIGQRPEGGPREWRREMLTRLS